MRATAYEYVDGGRVVAHAAYDAPADAWEFVIMAEMMDAGGISGTCRVQRLEKITEAQARVTLDRLGHAVTAACAAVRERREATTAAVRQAVMESATPPV